MSSKKNIKAGSLQDEITAQLAAIDAEAAPLLERLAEMQQVRMELRKLEERKRAIEVGLYALRGETPPPQTRRGVVARNPEIIRCFVEKNPGCRITDIAEGVGIIASNVSAIVKKDPRFRREDKLVFLND